MPSYEIRARARRGLSGHWGLSVLVTLVAALLGAGSGSGSSTATSGASSGSEQLTLNLGNWGISVPGAVVAAASVVASGMFIYWLVTLLFGGAAKLGLCRYNMDLVSRRHQPRFSTLFSCFAYFGRALLLNLVTSVLIFLWSLLFVIPGIVASYRYAMAPYIMAENPELGVFEAIRLSKEMMRGHKAELFWLELTFFGWGILCLFTLGIGFLWLAPYINASQAVFYFSVSGRPGYTLAGDAGYYAEAPGAPPPAG